MLDHDERSLERPLGDGLVLRTAASADDVEQVAAFNGAIHGPDAGTLTQSLFLHHPAPRGRDLFFVQDSRNGRVVSSLCLIPWTWRYEDIEIPSGELGIVGTAEDYRRRGLVRAQVKDFKERLRERGCLVSQIQGVPHFYRRFGYEYAIPLEGGLRLELRDVPEGSAPAHAFRLATDHDLPLLKRLYDEAAHDLEIHARRDLSTWEYLQSHADGTATERERWIVETERGQVAGYVGVPRYHFGEELAVNETSRLRFDAALAVLDHLKRLAVEREKPGVRLNLPAGCTLSRLARSLGARDLGTYAWQIHVPDLVGFLQALRPVLERRIADSPFSAFSQEVALDLYREKLTLRFAAGRIALLGTREVNADTAEVALRCPALQLIPLALGYRTWQELHSTYPDVSAPSPWGLLIDTLFPRMSSFLYMPY